MRSLVALVLVAGCAPGHTVVSGRVVLDVDVEPRAFATLELRGYTPDFHDPAMAVTVQFTDSVPIGEVAFPYDYLLLGPESVYPSVLVIGWLSSSADPVAARRGEPFGKAQADLCECATHTPAYAEDVTVHLDSVVE